MVRLLLWYDMVWYGVAPCVPEYRCVADQIIKTPKIQRSFRRSKCKKVSSNICLIDWIKTPDRQPYSSSEYKVSNFSDKKFSQFGIRVRNRMQIELWNKYTQKYLIWCQNLYLITRFLFIFIISSKWILTYFGVRCVDLSFLILNLNFSCYW